MYSVIEHISPVRKIVLFEGTAKECNDYMEDHKWDDKTMEILQPVGHPDIDAFGLGLDSYPKNEDKQ